MRETTKIYAGGSKTKIVRGEYTIKTDGNHSMWVTKGNIIVTAEKEITQQGENSGVSHGKYVPPEEIYTTHPKVEKVEFLDENNAILDQNTKNFFYGQRLKIKISTSNAKGQTIYVDLQGKTKSPNQKFDILNTKRFSWNGLVTPEEIFETPFFVLNPNWYSDDFEEYDYAAYETKIKDDDLNEFFAKVVLDAKNVFLPIAGNRLKPVTYKRNYEELIGLFKTDNSGGKDILTNYENLYIDKYADENEDTKDIVDDFSEWLCEDHTEASIEEIRAKVSESAARLWNYAVLQHHDHNMKFTTTNQKTGEKKEEIKPRKAILDDRPLYWARIAMQVILKRQYVFIKDIKTLSQKDQDDFFKKSIIPKSSKLWEIIVLFEEKSRNYTGVDFSKAGNKKKVLITGFDPFILNEFNNNAIKPYSPNIKQSNPSGIVALTFANNNTLGAYIQTMIVPVRYSDFDSKQDRNNGQGVGIIEKYITPHISNVDMIITVSQASEGDYHIDVFATATREGFNDNSDYVRADESKSISNDSPETISTTLPVSFSKGSSQAIFYGEYYQKNGETGVATLERYPKEKVYSGPGGNYLSNEIFYRVAKIRKDLKPSLMTGHFHISKIQSKGEDLSTEKVNALYETVKIVLKEGFKIL